MRPFRNSVFDLIELYKIIVAAIPAITIDVSGCDVIIDADNMKRAK
jgi:hypothetical protein